MAVNGEVINTAPPVVGNLAELLGFLLGTAVFLVLIGQDLRNAIRKGANWVPGHALVLSALSIQALNFVENQGLLLDRMLYSSNLKKPLSDDVIKSSLFMIHSGRVMLCVLVAFFLPGMARPNYQEKWTKIIALGLSVFLDILSELLSVRRRLGHSSLFLATNFINISPHARRVNLASFIVSGAIISTTLIWLIVLLICATLTSKSIRNLTTQRILYILGNPKAENWKAVEDQVLKSWIVSRACHPESIIASSVLGSSAAFGVTACVLFSIAAWIVQGPGMKFVGGAEFWLKFIITVMEVIFILIGWLIVCWRWLTASAYYEDYYRNKGQSESYDRSERQCGSSCFHVEDFWTRHILELKEAEESKLKELKVDEKISKIFARKLRHLRVNERHWLVVLLSKAFSFLTVYTLYNRFARYLVQKIILKWHIQKVKGDYVEDQHIVKNVKVLWQTPESVFSTNRRSIRQAKQIIRKGKRDGKNCHVLITLLGKYRERQKQDLDVPIESLDPGSAAAQRGLKYLLRRKVNEELGSGDVGEYLRYAGKRSWKLTAVSLIYIMVQLSPTSEAVWRDRLQEYYEAWEIIDLVESSDPETHSLLSKAADSLFNELHDPKENEKSKKQKPNSKEEPKVANKTPAITTLAKECEDKFDMVSEKIRRGQESPVDWQNLVAWNALYRLCKSIDCSSGNIDGLMNDLNNLFVDIIGGCLDRVRQALMVKCRTWAQDLEKKKLLEALYVAGKCSGLMEQLGVEEIGSGLMDQVRADETRVHVEDSAR
eukprot:PITA_28195